MAQNLAPKQLNFVRDFARAVTTLLQANDVLLSLVEQWNGNSYATGAEPLSNNITDEVLSGNAQIQDVAYMTAEQLNSAEGSVVSVQQTIEQHRGYLEAMRP
jgi:hypothetical protein